VSNISVIIRCRNEERWIGHAIQSVVDYFKYPQVIIVDDHSSDGSRRIIKTFDYLNPKILEIEDYSPGKSLNIGVEHCDHKAILILSAHCVLKKINFQKIIDRLEENVAVWGKQIPIWNGKKIKKRYMWSNFKDDDMVNYFCEDEDRPFLHNALCFYDRKFISNHPFREDLSGKEDRYWATDRIKEGHSIYYDASFVADHHYTTNGATWKGTG